jgi:hypothetical protein
MLSVVPAPRGYSLEQALPRLVRPEPADPDQSTVGKALPEADAKSLVGQATYACP